MPVDDRTDAGFLESEHCGERMNRAGQVLRVLAHDRDAVRVAILDHHAALAVEYQSAGRPQRKRALMVVLGHLVVLLVLHDLQDPEADGQYGEQDRNQRLKRCNSAAGFPSILNYHWL